jgi:hypothetical protein
VLLLLLPPSVSRIHPSRCVLLLAQLRLRHHGQ